MQFNMELDDNGQKLVQELGAAINGAIESSGAVAEAIEALRAADYDLELTLRLEIGLRTPQEKAAERERGAADAATGEPAPLNFTDEDIMTLRRMNIRLDD